MTEQSQLGPSKDGTVMLDIGGDIGALILHTGPDLLLAEIEISRVDGSAPLEQSAHAGDSHGDHSHEHGPDGHSHGVGDGHSHGVRTHVAVRERRGPSGVRYAAIYPGLRSGEYTIWGVDGQDAGNFVIVGGEVAELDWR